jgi:ligand-binding sensor domain-containing protein
MCCWCFATLHGQPGNYFGNNEIQLSREKDNYETKILGTQSGLPASGITCLAQSSKGFLWIGTSDGLSQFDGRGFKNFLKAGNYPTGKIHSIKEDTVRKVLWIACNAGLGYLKNEKLFLVKFHEPDATVYDIYLAPEGNVWVGTSTGPACFPLKTVSNILSDSIIYLSTFLLPQWKEINGPGKGVYKITGSKKGNLYFAGKESLFLYTNKTLESIWMADHQQSNNDEVAGLIPGNGETVFFASAYGGLYKVVKNKVTKVVSDHSVATALAERDGQLYYFTNRSIYKLYASTSHLEKISEVPGNVNLWISCLLIDNENNFWIGTKDNLLYQKRRIFYTYQSKDNRSSPVLYSVWQLKDNQLILGGNEGNIYLKDDASFKNYHPGNSGTMPLKEIRAIYQDSRGWLWLGSRQQGIAILKDKKLFHFTKADGLSNSSNYFFYEDANQNIYTGGNGGFSKIEYDSLAGIFLFKNFFFKTDSENVESFRNCLGGPDGSLWFIGENGILHFKENKLTKYEVEGMNMLNATDIKQDQLGSIWIATKGDGIWQCFFDDKNLLRVKNIIKEKDGLQSDIYLSLAADSKNTIWAAGYGGITSIKQSRGGGFNIDNYTSADGFLSSNYQSVRLFHDNKDTIWAVTSAGLVSFDAGKTTIKKTLSLSITNIFLLGAPHKNTSALKKELQSGIELPYDINGIEFQFKAICLSDARRIRYSYRMLGLKDTAWLDWVDKEIAIYQNLPPGKYSFQVKALLNNNVPSNLVTSSFIINKPFWLSGWFILISICLFLTIVYLIIKKWKKEVQYKNEEKIKTQKLISEHLQYRLEVEEVTNYFNQLMSATETEDELLWDVARQCISKLNFEDCVIYLKDKKTNNLIQKAAWGPKVIMIENDPSRKQTIQSPIEIPVGKGIVGTVAKTGIAEIVPDVTKDSRYILDDAQRSSEIAVPIIYGNRVLGVIDSESSHFNYYTQWHLQILTDVALHCAERIVKLRADKSLKKNKVQLLQTQQKLAEERLTALRSQMNPHFIFNSLK